MILPKKSPHAFAWMHGCVHMLHSVLLQPVPGPVLTLNAHGLNVQMVHCNLLCSLDATLASPQGAAQGHRFQLSSLPPPYPLPALGNWNPARQCLCSYSICQFWIKAGGANKAEQPATAEAVIQSHWNWYHYPNPTAAQACTDIFTTGAQKSKHTNTRGRTSYSYKEIPGCGIQQP